MNGRNEPGRPRGPVWFISEFGIERYRERAVENGRPCRLDIRPGRFGLGIDVAWPLLGIERRADEVYDSGADPGVNMGSTSPVAAHGFGDFVVERDPEIEPNNTDDRFRPKRVLRGVQRTDHAAVAFVGRSDNPEIRGRRIGLDIVDAIAEHLRRDFLAFRGVLERTGKGGGHFDIRIDRMRARLERVEIGIERRNGNAADETDLGGAADPGTKNAGQ